MNALPLPVNQTRFIFAFLASGALALLSFGETLKTGTIEGRVFNSATGTALPNARVSVDGRNSETVTDGSGSYRLAEVPEGSVAVTVFYVGMQRQTAAVNVLSGGTARLDFELTRAVRHPGTEGEPVKLEAFEVVAEGIKSAQELAMNEQRNAPNIKNVVAIDEYGERGQENIGEFLHFLPGVAVDYGLGGMSIRGFPLSDTSVQLDGGEIAGARSNTRQLTLSDVPMNNVSRVEVVKVPTPDLPASGLGGTVNLITKSGFEVKKPTLSYELYSQFHSAHGIDLSGGPVRQHSGISPDYNEPSYSLNYQHPINDSLAITLGLAHTWRLNGHNEDTRDEIMFWNQVSGFQRFGWVTATQLM
jgi:iron complex outermembrane recepter protein